MVISGMNVAILLLMSFQFIVSYHKEDLFLPENGNDPFFKAEIKNIISSIKTREIRLNKSQISIRTIAIFGYYNFKVNIIISSGKILFVIRQKDWSFLNESQRNTLEKIFDFSIVFLKNPTENMLHFIKKNYPSDKMKSIAFDNYDFEIDQLSSVSKI